MIVPTFGHGVRQTLSVIKGLGSNTLTLRHLDALGAAAPRPRDRDLVRPARRGHPPGYGLAAPQKPASDVDSKISPQRPDRRGQLVLFRTGLSPGPSEAPVACAAIYG